jgi:hypothetical protein
MERAATRGLARTGAAGTRVAHVSYGRAMSTPAPALPSEVLTPVVGAGAIADLAAGRTAIGVDHGGNIWFAGDSDLVRGTDGRIWVLAGGSSAFIREGEIERLSG